MFSIFCNLQVRHASFNDAFRRLQRRLRSSGRRFVVFHAPNRSSERRFGRFCDVFHHRQRPRFQVLAILCKDTIFFSDKGTCKAVLFTCHAPSTTFFHSPQCSTSKHSIKCAGKEFKTPSYPCLRESMSCGERLGQLIDSRFCLYKVGCSKSKKIKVGKEAPAPSQWRFALARIIVCCGASIVAHFACKVRATNT